MPVPRLFRPALPAAVALVIASLVAPCASAAPAPWYWWSSKLDGKRVCAQSMPGQGWERGEGPFTDAACRHTRR